jgi:hypothetical protein
MAQDSRTQHRTSQDNTGQDEEREGSEMREGKEEGRGRVYGLTCVSSLREFASTILFFIMKN